MTVHATYELVECQSWGRVLPPGRPLVPWA